MAPNFVFILADDLGYADLGCYGGRTPCSPELDRLAMEGVRFTYGYSNSPVCSPTRFALMTGRFQYRLRGGNDEPIASRHRGSLVLGLPPAHPTLPYLAQGAAMAIEDGAVLTRALSMMPTIPDALQLYQRNRVDRTAKVVLQSSENRRLFHLHSVAEMRAAFAKRDEGADRNTWLYSYNPLTVPLT